MLINNDAKLEVRQTRHIENYGGRLNDPTPPPPPVTEYV